MKRLLFLALLPATFTHAMQEPKAVVPQQRTIDGAFAVLPTELRLDIIKHLVEENKITTCKNIRALTPTCRSFNELINQQSANHLINYLAAYYPTTRLQAALHLRTHGAGQWLQAQLANDRNGEFAQEVINKFARSALGANCKTPTTNRILQQTLSTEVFSPDVIQDFLRCTFHPELLEDYKILEFLIRRVPTIVDRKYSDESRFTALMYATVTNNPAAVELLLKAGANPAITKADGQNALQLAQSAHDFLKRTSGLEVRGQFRAMNAIRHKNQNFSACEVLRLLKQASGQQSSCSIM